MRQVIIYGGELYHHGILGQKWGQRNGPPYPLNPEDHSAREKKAGWRKSLNDEDNTAYKYNKPGESAWKGAARAIKAKYDGLSDNQKKAIKIGAAVVGTALATYATYKVVDFVNDKKAIKVGMAAYNQAVKDRKMLNQLVEDSKKLRTGDNAAYSQKITVGNQHYSWTNFANHPELIPEHLKDSKNGNVLKERAVFKGETPNEAFNREYNRIRYKKKRI